MKNKNQTRKMLIIASTICAIILIIIGCNKLSTNPVVNSETNGLKTLSPPQSNSNVLQACVCATSVPGGICPNFKNCAKSILGNALSRNFVIDWTNCSGCGQATNPPPSNGKICYTANCGELQVQFSNLPQCMWQCYGELTNCFIFTSIVCSNGQFSMQFVGDNGNQTITITGDPDITMDCTKNGVTNTCVGKLNWTI